MHPDPPLLAVDGLLHESVFERCPLALVQFDSQGNIRKVNQAFCQLTGFSPAQAEEQLGAFWALPDTLYRPAREALELHGIWQGTLLNRHRDGCVFRQWTAMFRLKDGYLALMSDLEQDPGFLAQVQATDQDIATGLPSRRQLVDRLDVAVAAAQRSHRQVAVFFIDLDHFKRISTHYGTHATERFLRAVGERIRACLRAEDTVGHVGGDEYVVILPDIGSERDAIEPAQRILNAFNRPFWIGAHEVLSGACVGMSFFPHDGRNPDDLIRCAEIAMEQARSQGGGYQLFTAEMNERLLRRLDMERNVANALERGRILPYYQPRICLQTGEILGCEALARWVDEDGRLIAPAEFIGLAEETGLILPLGESILRPGSALAPPGAARSPVGQSLALSVSSEDVAGYCAQRTGGFRSGSAVSGARNHREHHHGEHRCRPAHAPSIAAVGRTDCSG